MSRLPKRYLQRLHDKRPEWFANLHHYLLQETANPVRGVRFDVPHPEVYGHCDASVTTGSIESSVFDVFKGGLFRSFDQQGPGKYRLHAHVMSGEIDLGGSD